MSVKRDSGWASRVVLAVALSWMLSSLAPAEILNVPDDYPTIQEAIDAAEDGDEILVAPGTYAEAIDLLGKAVWLHSSDGPDVTTIQGPGWVRVVACISGEDADTIVEGFTITGGDFKHGAGMYIKSSSPTVTDCWFVDNNATYHAAGMGIFECQTPPTVTGCLFINNTAVYDGGGMKIQNGAAIVTDCVFERNSSYRGGAIYCEIGSADLIGCSFTDNEAAHGGAVCVTDGSDVRLLNAAFTLNSCTGGGGAAYVGYDSKLNLVNCALLDNAHTGGNGEAGGIYIAPGCAAKLANCTFTGNTSTQNYDAIFIHPDNDMLTVLANCIVWANGINTPIGGGGPVDITYSDLQDLLPGEGNIDADPLFVDPENGDCHLSAGSPCIDAGANNALPPDTLDLDEDGDVAERIPLDFDGNPRFADDPDTDDTGCGAPVIVDMGACEYPGDAWHPMRIGDIDGDGDVDSADLDALLAAWGVYEDECVLADLDLSGRVDTADLLTLLANWG